MMIPFFYPKLHRIPSYGQDFANLHIESRRQDLNSIKMTSREGDRSSQGPPSSTNVDKGKGKTTNTASQGKEESRPAPSLLSSAFSGARSDLPGSLNGVLSSGQKGNQGTNGSSAAHSGQSASLASETTGRGSASSSSSEALGPRQGFRASNGETSSANAAQVDGNFQNGFNNLSLQDQPQSLLSERSIADTQISSEPQYGTYDSLNQALHNLVRRSSFTNKDSISNEQEDSSIKEMLEHHPEFLDPSYHEAWARSIPGTVFDQGLSQYDNRGQQQHLMEQTWNTSLQWRAKDQEDVKRHQMSFIELLDAEEEEQFAKESVATDETDATTLPAPEPSSMLQSTDPREALSFILGPSDEEKNKMREQLQSLSEQLKQAQGQDSSRSSLGTPDPEAQPSGLDRKSRRRDRRRQLAQIEYELSLLEHKTGYIEEVWSGEQPAVYPPGPDYTGIGEDEGDGESHTESEVEQRRRKAVQRLEALRRHLEAKL
ncbi:unnamed protein product [Sympodiomycopsis kandeliae]